MHQQCDYFDAGTCRSCTLLPQPYASQLADKGAVVQYHDPHVPHWTAVGGRAERVDDLDAAVPAADLVVLVQNHREYDVDALAQRAQRFFDTRGVAAEGERVSRL